MRTEDLVVCDDEVATDTNSTVTGRSSAAPQQEEQAGSSAAAAAAIEATPAEATATLVTTTTGRTHSSSSSSNLGGARPLRSLAARNRSSRSSRSSRGPAPVVAPSVDSILDAKAVIIAASATALSTLHEGEEENDPEDPAIAAVTEDPAATEDEVPAQAQSPILLEDSKPRFTVIQVSNIQSQDVSSSDIKSDHEGSESHHDVERGDNVDAFPTLATAHMVTIPTISNISDHSTIQQERDRFREQVRNEMLAAEMNAVQRAQPVEMARASRRDSNKDGEGSTLNDTSPAETTSPKATSTLAPTTRPRRKRYAVHAGVALSVVTLLFIGAIASLWSRIAARQGNDPTDSASPTTTAAPTNNNASETSLPDDIVWLPDGRQAFTTTAQLYRAVDDYDAALQANETAEGSIVAMQYGYPMGIWDVSRLTDFSKVFCVDREQKLEADVRLSARRTMHIPSLSGWNVSQATTMHGMFAGAVNWLSEDDGLIAWDVGRVTDFSFMFGYAEVWTGNSIASWNTSSATLMNSMFVRASKFNADLSRWDVARVTSMSYMMCEAKIYIGGDLTSWQVGQVRSMAYMFSNAKAFTGAISTWDTSSVETMKHTFYGASSFNGDLSRWNVGKVSNMNSFFLGAHAFTGGDLSNWNTGLVVDMYYVFGLCANFNGTVSAWNVSSVQSFEGAFEFNDAFEQDVSQWDVHAATSMTKMFKDALVFNSNLTLWNTSKVTTMADMFQNAKVFNGDLTTWNLSSVQDAARMFQSADSFNQSLCAWQSKLPKGATVTEMFDLTNCIDTSEPSLSLAAVEDAAVSHWSGPFCTPCSGDADV